MLKVANVTYPDGSSEQGDVISLVEEEIANSCDLTMEKLVVKFGDGMQPEFTRFNIHPEDGADWCCHVFEDEYMVKIQFVDCSGMFPDAGGPE